MWPQAAEGRVKRGPGGSGRVGAAPGFGRVTEAGFRGTGTVSP